MRKQRMQGGMQRAIRPERILAAGFLAAIAAGTLVLMLPAAAGKGQSLNWFDSLFTATSAVCVTGLSVLDAGRRLSFFGQAILLALIQLGGLGFMIFATLLMQALGRRISLQGQMLIRESLNVTTLSGLLNLSGRYGLMTLMIEGCGAMLLALRFVPLYGWRLGLWFSVFHSVSAFCNAGFDLFGNFQSLGAFRQDPLVLMTVSALVILGGLGFSVMQEMLPCRRRIRRRWSLHTRLVLTSTLVLLAAGTFFFALVEWNNPFTLGIEGNSPGVKILNAFFQSVTLRTAGFGTMELGKLRESSKLMSVMLMFIGASPASTGGGVKTTTVTVLVLIVISVIRGREDVGVFARRLPSTLMRRALAVLCIDLTMLLAGAMVLTLAEGDGYLLIDLLLESTSAMATVGVSSIGTVELCTLSRAALLPMMYFGRVGPLTLAFALARRQESARAHLRYPEENVMIG